MTHPLLVQLSDPHIRAPGQLAYGRIDTAPYLARAVRHIGRLPQRPDAVVITGDLCDFGRAAEYAHLRSLLAPLTMPVFLLPGNHDAPDALRQAFPSHTYLGAEGSGPVHFSVALGALQLIALDTSVPGQSHGALDPAQLDWLDRELQQQRQQGRGVILALHHPPFRTLIGHMDRIGLLQGAEALAAVVARHPHVERVICGHLHRSIQVRFAGTIALTAPSPAHQICLDLAEDAASAWSLEPPAMLLHAWDGARCVSHLQTIGDHDGPYPFHEPDGRLID